MFVCTTQRDYTVRCKTYLTTKKHTGRGGKQGGSKVISGYVCVCIRPLSNSSCKKKNSKWFVLSDCRTEWVEFAAQDELMNVKKHLQVKLLSSCSKPPPTGSTNQIKTDAKISLQLQSEAGLVFGKSGTVWGATGRHCPIFHFIGAICLKTSG